MSEYQYYEFQAVDRPLTKTEIQTLRSYSSRAEISPTSFKNEYNWGDFKGNPDRWMEKYFDAFFYFANWGTRIFQLRLPTSVLAPKLAKQYCLGRSASVRMENGYTIISFNSDSEDGDWDIADYGLASIVSVRSELAAGDYRALYLAWLVCLQCDEIKGKATEPPVPPGLQELSGPLESLVALLRLDRDILAVAAIEIFISSVTEISLPINSYVLIKFAIRCSK